MPSSFCRARAWLGRVLLALCLVSFAGTSSSAFDPQSGTGLKLPRFASLRATRVNLRSGPGVRFPIEWVYIQRDLPVEIIQEFDNWRRIRDWEGTEGWIYHSMLSGRRALRISVEQVDLHQSKDPASPIVARLRRDVVGQLLKCPQGTTHCQVAFGNLSGWLPRAAFWGVYQGEVVD